MLLLNPLNPSQYQATIQSTCKRSTGILNNYLILFNFLSLTSVPQKVQEENKGDFSGQQTAHQKMAKEV